jgi:hypothetical protein
VHRVWISCPSRCFCGLSLAREPSTAPCNSAGPLLIGGLGQVLGTLLALDVKTCPGVAPSRAAALKRYSACNDDEAVSQMKIGFPFYASWRDHRFDPGWLQREARAGERTAKRFSMHTASITNVILLLIRRIWILSRPASRRGTSGQHQSDEERQKLSRPLRFVPTYPIPRAHSGGSVYS